MKEKEQEEEQRTERQEERQLSKLPDGDQRKRAQSHAGQELEQKDLERD